MATRRGHAAASPHSPRGGKEGLGHHRPPTAPAWVQKIVTIPPQKRGFHLVTQYLLSKLPELKNYSMGMANFFIQHTSASLTINENADPDVRKDFETTMNRLIPDDLSLYKHTDEGADDASSHIKTSLMGPSVSVPIMDGELAFGTWQGIYLCEHRNYGSARRIVITIQGLPKGQDEEAG